MAVKDLEVVYGGPFAHEGDTILSEVNVAKAEEREPDFDKLTENWETISAGALAIIVDSKGEPDESIDPAVQRNAENVDLTTVVEFSHPEVVQGDIVMPPPLEGFIPVVTFEAPEEDIFDEDDSDEENEEGDDNL